MNKDIQKYNSAQTTKEKIICDVLMKEIHATLPQAEGKIWHGGPVWFLDGNPVVGYSKLKDCIQLLFWSGQSFASDGLKPVGKFKAAEARYRESGTVDIKQLKEWLQDAEKIQWDYKNIVKRKGRLERLK